VVARLDSSKINTTIGGMTTGPDSPSQRTLAEVRRLLTLHEKKAKTSVSLSGELLRAADAIAGKSARSALIERALRRYLRAIIRRDRHRRDLETIDANAATTNRESDVLLELQAWPE